MSTRISTLIPKLLIGYVDRSDEEDDASSLLPVHGLTYALALVTISFVGSLAETHAFFQLNLAGMKTKTAMIAAIFRKALGVKQPKGKQQWSMLLIYSGVHMKLYTQSRNRFRNRIKEQAMVSIDS